MNNLQLITEFYLLDPHMAGLFKKAGVAIMKLILWLARDEKAEKKTYLYALKPHLKNGDYHYAGSFDYGIIGPLPKHYGLRPGECRKIEVQL
jgi:hypothetical protein